MHKYERRLLVAAGAVLVTAGTALAVADPATAATLPTVTTTGGYLLTDQSAAIGGPSTQMYEISAAGSPGTLLTVDGGSTAQGAEVGFANQTTGSDGLPQTDQLWTFVPADGSSDLFSGSWGELENVKSQECLNIAGGSTSSGVELIQWPCLTQSNEEWQAVSTGSRTFGFASAEASGVYLGQSGSPDCTAAAGSPAVTSGTDGGACASWSVQRVGGQPITLPNAANTSMVIDSDNPDGNWLTQAVTEPANSKSATQAWYLQEVGTTSSLTADEDTLEEDWVYDDVTAPLYRIVQVTNDNWADAVCLEAEGSQPAVGAEVETYGCDPNAYDQPNQLWILANSLDSSDGEDVSQVTSVNPNYGSGDFVMFNDAMLGANQNTTNYPVLSVSSTAVAADGSQLTMQDQGSTVEPLQSQVWTLSEPSSGSGSSGSGGGSSSGCTMYACLVDA